jgi:hypothetical protein
MSNPVKEEFERFKKLFLNYSKVIVSGMILSSIFLSLYAGLRANYVFIAVLTTILATITLSLVILLLYVRFQVRRDGITERNRAGDEELRKLITEAIAGLQSTETKTLPKPTLLVAQHVLLSVFQWGHLIGQMFYRGLSMVRFESGFGKGPKEV